MITHRNMPGGNNRYENNLSRNQNSILRLIILQSASAVIYLFAIAFKSKSTQNLDQPTLQSVIKVMIIFTPGGRNRRFPNVDQLTARKLKLCLS